MNDIETPQVPEASSIRSKRRRNGLRIVDEVLDPITRFLMESRAIVPVRLVIGKPVHCGSFGG